MKAELAMNRDSYTGKKEPKCSALKLKVSPALNGVLDLCLQVVL